MQLSPQLQQQLAQAVRTSMHIEGYRSAPEPQRTAQAQALMAQHHIGVRPTHTAKLPPLVATDSTESEGAA